MGHSAVLAKPSRGTDSLRRWGAVGLLLLAALLRLWDLGGQSFWYDEAYSWWVSVELSPSAAIESSIREAIPPFTYFLWRVWAALAGTSELALRASSALSGVVAVAALAGTARRLSRSRDVLPVALALAAVAPPMVWASRELRMYGPILASVLLADWALANVLMGGRRYRRVWAWVWGAMSLISLYTIVLSGFWLLGQACFTGLILLGGRRRAGAVAIVRALWAPAAAAALLYLPWLVPALRSFGELQGYWPGTLTPDVFFSVALRGIVVFRGIDPAAGALVLSGAVAVFAAVLPPVLSPRGRRLTLYGLVTTLPPLLVASLLYRDIPKWDLQHTVIFSPGLVLALAAAGAGAKGRRGRVLRSLVLGSGLLASCGLFVLATGRLLCDPVLANDDWRGAVAYVESHRQPGEPVIIETGAVAPTWRYYGSAEGLLPLPDDPLVDVSHTLHYSNTAPVLNEALARAPGVWVVGWLREVTDPTGIVSVLLSDLGESEPVPAYHGLELAYTKLTRAPDFPEEPPTTGRPALDLLEGVSLWGVTLPVASHPADAPVPVRSWWTVADPPRHRDRAYWSSVQIVDGRGNVWGGADGPVGAGDFRSERWPAGTRVLGVYDVSLLSGTPSGIYTVTQMLYSLDGDRSERVTVGSITVGRPASLPSVPETVTPVPVDGGEGPLDLVGVRLGGSSVEPCGALEGWLFWEISSPLVADRAVRVSLADDSFNLTATDLTPMQWQVGDRFLTPFRLQVDCRAGGALIPLDISLLADNEGTGEGPEVARWVGPEVEIRVERVFTPPDLMYTTEMSVGHGVAKLIGYDIEPAEVPAGDPFRVVLYWEAGDPTDTPLTVFVHIVPRGRPGPIAAQHDAWPADGGKPTYTWVPGEIVTDPHPLPALSPGAYDIRVGVYGPDAVRLPLARGGERVLDDVAVLAGLAVE